jgi:hypothetical protein
MVDSEQQACHKHTVTRTMRLSWVQINLTQTGINPRKSCAPGGDSDYILCRGSSEWNLLHVTLLTPRILWQLLDLSRNCEPLTKLFTGTTVNTHRPVPCMWIHAPPNKLNHPIMYKFLQGCTNQDYLKIWLQKWECQDHVYGGGGGNIAFVYKHTFKPFQNTIQVLYLEKDWGGGGAEIMFTDIT